METRCKRRIGSRKGLRKSARKLSKELGEEDKIKKGNGGERDREEGDNS